MALVFRTDDLGLWGLGKGSNLTPREVDLNFWFLFSLISAVNDHLDTAAVSIADITQPTPSTLSIILTDSTVLGPFTIPTSQWNFRDAWLPTTTYAANDVVTNNASAYLVKTAHVSGATFDPGAGGGAYYGLLFTVPGSVIPLGGTTGQSLQKVSNADLAMAWADRLFSACEDVALGSPLDPNYTIYFNGTHWTSTQYVREQSLLQLKAQTVSQVGGVLTIDRALGEIVNCTASANITSVVVTNWAPTGYHGKIILQIDTDGFTVSGTPVTVWNGGSTWAASGGIDRVAFSSDTAGASVYGDIIGQSYS